jgi:hypothetical protein
MGDNWSFGDCNLESSRSIYFVEFQAVGRGARDATQNALAFWLPPANKIKARFLGIRLLESNTVSGIMRHRACRALLIGCLLLTQFQLLWMAAFHWNENPLPATASPVTVWEKGRQGHQPTEKNPCTVCQIVRQNAVRPGIGAPIQQPFSAVCFHPLTTSQGFHSYRPHVARGRAPPLA